MKRWRWSVLAVVAGMVLPEIVSAGEWVRGFGTAGSDLAVEAFAVHRDVLYVARTTLYTGGTVPALAQWDGATWRVVPGTELRAHYGSADLKAMCSYGADLVLAGRFSEAGGVSVQGIGRWDGANWHGFGLGLGEGVRALAVFDGYLVAGGGFTESGARRLARIARWDGAEWQQIGDGFDRDVIALTVHEGRLIAAGAFTRSGSTAMTRVAAWDGRQWVPLGSGFPATVEALTTFRGNLIAAGSFGMAAWDGVTWHPFGEGLEGHVRALGEYDGRLIVTGTLDWAGAVRLGGIAAWDGVSWKALDEGLSGESSHYVPGIGLALATYRGELYVGGNFGWAGHVPTNHIARWDGTTWKPVNGRGFTPTGARLGVVLGRLLASANRLLRSDPPSTFLFDDPGDGWVPFLPGVRGDTPAIGAFMDYRTGIVVAGDFFLAGDTEARNIAWWDGSAWRALGDGIWEDDPSSATSVHALAIYRSELFAGGHFNRAGSVGVSNIARWDGTRWSDVGGGMNGDVEALAVLGSELYAAGYFTMAGGDSARGIARWSGTRWRPLVPILRTPGDPGAAGGPERPRFVRSLAIHKGQLIVAADFSDDVFSSRSAVGCWNESGWEILGEPPDHSGTIQTIVADSAGLYVGGLFDEIGGVTAHDIAYWNGASWESVGSGVNGGVQSLAILNDTLFVSGTFDSAGSGPADGLAAWIGMPVHELDPPVLELGVHPNPGLPQYFDVYVLSSEPLDRTSMALTLDGNPLAARTHDGTVWRADVRLPSGDGIHELRAGARDVNGNEGLGVLSFAAARLSAGEDASITSPDGRFVARLAGETLARSAAALVTQERRVPGTYGVELGEGNDGSLVTITMRYEAETGDAPAIERVGDGPLESFIDPAHGTVVASVRGGGQFRLAAGGAAASRLIDTNEPALRVMAASPDPFRAGAGTGDGRARVRFDLDAGYRVRVTVYDVNGREVVSLLDRELALGAHEASWDGRDTSGAVVRPGMYFYRVEAGGESVVRKVVLLR